MHTVTTLNPVLIEKEEIRNLTFPSERIELSKDETSILKKKIRDSMILGNMHKNKSKIIFEDDRGVKEVRTTIWAAGEKYIVLKQGIAIPVHRILTIIL